MGVTGHTVAAPIPTCRDCPMFVTHRRPRSWDQRCCRERKCWVTDCEHTLCMMAETWGREENWGDLVCYQQRGLCSWQTTEWSSREHHVTNLVSQGKSVDDVRKFVGDLLAMSSARKRLCTFLFERSGIIFVCIIPHCRYSRSSLLLCCLLVSWLCCCCLICT